MFFKPPVPADNYDVDSDCYSWNWGQLHLVQAHRFAGDTTKGAVSGLPWLQATSPPMPRDGRPVILFQHYGWDPFSLERWDPAKRPSTTTGAARRTGGPSTTAGRMLDALDGYNVVGIFHGHQHETPMIYSRDGLDIFKPKAAYMGGFALVRLTDIAMDVVLGEASGEAGAVTYTNAFNKKLRR